MADDRPRWREDFPVRWDEDHYVTRRELAKFLTLGSGLLAGAKAVTGSLNGAAGKFEATAQAAKQAASAV